VDDTPIKTVSGKWEMGTRAGTFRRFLEAFSELGRDEFLAKLPWPHLLIGAEPDPKTWDGAVVVRVAPQREGGTAIVAGSAEGEVDIVLNCPTISRRHAAFSANEGKWVIFDLESTLGTYVDGTLLPPGERRPLGETATIDLGLDVRATFYQPEALFAFVAEAKAARPGTPPSKPKPAALPGQEGREPWPTYSLLQTPGPRGSTVRMVPGRVMPPGWTPAIEKTIARSGAPEEPRPQIVRPSFWAVQRKALFGTRRAQIRTALLALMIATLVFFYGKPFASVFLLESHPEWFVEDDHDGK
jgi:hypothetical protein